MTTPINGLTSNGSLDPNSLEAEIQAEVSAQLANQASLIFGAGGTTDGTSASQNQQNGSVSQTDAVNQAVNNDVAAVNSTSPVASTTAAAAASTPTAAMRNLTALSTGKI